MSADVCASHLLEEKLPKVYREILLKGEKNPILSAGKISDYADKYRHTLGLSSKLRGKKKIETINDRTKPIPLDSGLKAFIWDCFWFWTRSISTDQRNLGSI